MAKMVKAEMTAVMLRAMQTEARSLLVDDIQTRTRPAMNYINHPECGQSVLPLRCMRLQSACMHTIRLG
jgi:hypothetical protein